MRWTMPPRLSSRFKEAAFQRSALPAFCTVARVSVVDIAKNADEGHDRRSREVEVIWRRSRLVQLLAKRQFDFLK
jgi:hypothetical protein